MTAKFRSNALYTRLLWLIYRLIVIPSGPLALAVNKSVRALSKDRAEVFFLSEGRPGQVSWLIRDRELRHRWLVHVLLLWRFNQLCGDTFRFDASGKIVGGEKTTSVCTTFVAGYLYGFMCHCLVPLRPRCLKNRTLTNDFRNRWFI